MPDGLTMRSMFMACTSRRGEREAGSSRNKCERAADHERFSTTGGAVSLMR